METSVSVCFWFTDIVFFSDQKNIILTQKIFGNQVNVLRKSTDYTNSGNLRGLSTLAPEHRSWKDLMTTEEFFRCHALLALELNLL